MLIICKYSLELNSSIQVAKTIMYSSMFKQLKIVFELYFSVYVSCVFVFRGQLWESVLSFFQVGPRNPLSQAWEQAALPDEQSQKPSNQILFMEETTFIPLSYVLIVSLIY